MNTAAWTLATVLAWGAWLAPLQGSPDADERWKTFWITAAILGVSAAVAAASGFEGLTSSLFWPAVAGGVLWSWSGLAAVAAVQRLGMAGAMGIWSPLNILVSLVWGAALFGEFDDWTVPGLMRLAGALAVMLAGIGLIAYSRRSTPGHTGRAWVGLLAAAAAGIGWGSYFLPLRWAGVSPWVGAFPLALGMMAGNLPLLAFRRRTPGARGVRIAALAATAGLMWCIGNYGSLFMMEGLGTGRGFTIAQSCVVVNGLLGVFAFRDPAPGSRTARVLLAGILLATLGAVGVGRLS